MNLKNLSLSELLNLDASRLSANEVAYIEKRLSRTANLRRNKLKENKLKGLSSALNKAKKPFTRTTAKDVKNVRYKIDGKTVKRRGNLRNKQLENISRLKQFLNDPTSTVKGTQKTIRNLQELVRKTSGSDRTLNKKELKRFFKLWDKARELMGGTMKVGKKDGSPVWKQIVELLKSSSNDKYIRNDEIMNVLEKTIEKEYEDAQELINELNEEDQDGFEVDEIDLFDEFM